MVQNFGQAFPKPGPVEGMYVFLPNLTANSRTRGCGVYGYEIEYNGGVNRGSLEMEPVG